MSKIKDYIKLIRPFHWVKNTLTFFPLIFSNNFFNLDKLAVSIIGFAAFCFIASSVYVINDYRDADKDKLHPTKKNRPIASGRISKRSALTYFVFLVISGMVIAITVALNTGYIWSWIIPLAYLILNVLYSAGLKNIPIVDVVILALGFILRIYYGGAIIEVPISSWLMLTITAASLFLGFGKRRNELLKGTKTRKVLQAYNYNFLDKIMYLFLSLTLVFYSLWTIDASETSNPNARLLIYTVPLVMVIVADYSLIIEGESDGDPAEVLKHSPSLIILLLVYIISIMGILYF